MRIIAGPCQHEGLAHSQTDAEFNAKLSQNIKMITGANNDA